MKKTIAFITAMLIAAAFTGCNSSPDNSNTPNKPDSSNSSEQATEAPTKVEKEAIDPFENITYTISEESIYPNNFEITFDASETPFGQEMNFTFFVESANSSGIVIKAKADIDDVDDIIEKNNYIIEESEITFTIPISELNASLITQDQLTTDNINLMTEEMKNIIIEKTGQNEEYKNECKLEKIYITVPKTTEFEVQIPKKESKPKPDENSFEDRYINTCSLKINDDSFCHIIGIFSNNQNEYYAITNSDPNFKNEKIESEYLTLINLIGCPYEFTNIEDAYNAALNEILFTEKSAEKYDIIEIPLS